MVGFFKIGGPVLGARGRRLGEFAVCFGKNSNTAKTTKWWHNKVCTLLLCHTVGSSVFVEILSPWHQVKDLIDSFPDSDKHLMKFCKWHPESMTMKELLNLMKCPQQREKRERESEWEREWVSEWVSEWVGGWSRFLCSLSCIGICLLCSLSFFGIWVSFQCSMSYMPLSNVGSVFRSM